MDTTELNTGIKIPLDDGALRFLGYVSMTGVWDRQCIGCGLKLSLAGSPFIHKRGCEWMEAVKQLVSCAPFKDSSDPVWCCSDRHVKRPLVKQDKFLRCGCYSWCSCDCPTLSGNKFLL